MLSMLVFLVALVAPPLAAVWPLCRHRRWERIDARLIVVLGLWSVVSIAGAFGVVLAEQAHERRMIRSWCSANGMTYDRHEPAISARDRGLRARIAGLAPLRELVVHAIGLAPMRVMHGDLLLGRWSGRVERVVGDERR